MKVSYVALSAEQKEAVNIRLQQRLDAGKSAKEIHPSRTVTLRILIVGDRPGPSAPTDPDYHHTPFHSTKHCSGWLNAALEVEGISERELVWLNSADQHGEPTDPAIIRRLNPYAIVCLGGNAEKWVKKAGHDYIKVDHPQYHKRFKNNERYPLLDVLKKLISDKEAEVLDMFAKIHSSDKFTVQAALAAFGGVKR